MATRKNSKARTPSLKKDKELRLLYAKYRREFSAADLQKYTALEEGVPFKKVLEECEAIYAKNKRKKA